MPAPGTAEMQMSKPDDEYRWKPMAQPEPETVKQVVAPGTLKRALEHEKKRPRWRNCLSKKQQIRIVGQI